MKCFHTALAKVDQTTKKGERLLSETDTRYEGVMEQTVKGQENRYSVKNIYFKRPSKMKRLKKDLNVTNLKYLVT